LQYTPLCVIFAAQKHANINLLQLFRVSLQNATHFVGVAYPSNKISKTVLKMQAFYTCFLKFYLALNSYNLLYYEQLGLKRKKCLVRYA